MHAADRALQLQQGERRPGGETGREDPENQERDERHGGQRDDLRTDRPVAGSHQAPPEGLAAIRRMGLREDT